MLLPRQGWTLLVKHPTRWEGGSGLASGSPTTGLLFDLSSVVSFGL